MSDFFDTVQEGGAKVSSLEEGKFGAKLLTYPNGEKAVLKVQPFANDKYRGIPKSEMPKREVAAYVLDRDVLDFGVVPETILLKWKGRDASAQKFIPSGLAPRAVVPGLFDRKQDDWKLRIAKFFLRINLDDMLKVVLLDLIIDNCDRHGRNVLIDTVQHKVWAIDNGLAFGRYYRGYRSVFHKYLYFKKLPLPEWAVKKLGRIEKDDLDVLSPYLDEEDIQQTWFRLQFILGHQDRLAYSRMGATSDLGGNKFPSYEEWFKRQTQMVNNETALVLSPQVSVDAQSL